VTQFIPTVLVSPRAFTARMIQVFNPETKLWEVDAARSEPDVNEQMRLWREKEQPEIRFVSAPSTSVYQQSATEQTMFVGVSVLYVPAVEGAVSARYETPEKTTVARVVVQAKPAGSAAAGVFKPPG
jgi:hypothetical protein